MTKVLIIGATSSIAQATAKYLLNNTDDQITLMARYVGMLDTDPKRERVVQGDIIDAEALDEALMGNDVVLVALDSNEERLIQKIVDAMRNQNIKRLLFLTSMGICNEVPITAGASGNLTEESILRPYEETIDVIKNSGLDYTIIRPSWLDNGQDTNYEIIRGSKVTGKDHVSMASLVNLIVRLAHDDKMAAHENLEIRRAVNSR